MVLTISQESIRRTKKEVLPITNDINDNLNKAISAVQASTVVPGGGTKNELSVYRH